MSFASPPAAPHAAARDSSQIRVMIVDDSLVIRGFISRALDSDPAFKVVATASNGQLAVDALKRNPADVIILDIEMPVMDGLTAIPLLKEIAPAAQIVMASTLTQRNADISIKAMELGATDYLPKPSAREMAVPGEFQRELKEKIKVLGAIALRKSGRSSLQKGSVVPAIAPADKKKAALRPMPLFRPDIIAIGSSTGGPQALFEVIKAIGPDISQPVVITQHMPPSFTAILAEHIARQSGVTCTEAKEGDILRPGMYYVAPGDFHMLFEKRAEGTIVRPVKDPPENFCRPAVDPMLRSLVGIYGGRILTVILTGMGQDGAKGAECVVSAGGAVIAQDEASSVVWGMPGACAAAGLCSAIVPLAGIGAMVRQIATRGGA